MRWKIIKFWCSAFLCVNLSCCDVTYNCYECERVMGLCQWHDIVFRGALSFLWVPGCTQPSSGQFTRYHSIEENNILLSCSACWNRIEKPLYPGSLNQVLCFLKKEEEEQEERKENERRKNGVRNTQEENNKEKWERKRGKKKVKRGKRKVKTKRHQQVGR